MGVRPKYSCAEMVANGAAGRSKTGKYVTAAATAPAMAPGLAHAQTAQSTP